MAQGEFVAKLNYLCSNIKHIEDFLIFSEDINKNLSCADAEAHSPEWCGGVCTNIKWLLPLLAELKKTRHQRQKFLILQWNVLKATL